MMERIVDMTNDGSHTILVPSLQTSYHSKHGAIQESRHVFIEAGLDYLKQQQPSSIIRIMELGFGTGLNALLSWQYAIQQRQAIDYLAIEPFPLEAATYEKLNYEIELSAKGLLTQLHQLPAQEPALLHPLFRFTKYHQYIQTFQAPYAVQLIYFDAFSPEVQPELWTAAIFKQLYLQLTPGGMLVTYCSKSLIRKRMTETGFKVTKIPGPWGKREMVRAIRVE